MRIAIFTDTYPPFINGVSTSCYNLAKTLKEHGEEVLVVCPRTTDGPLYVEDNIIYVPGVELKKFYSYRLTSLFPRKVLKLVKDFKPDVIHNNTDVALGQFSKMVSRILKVPYVYTYHTSYEDYTYYATKGFLDRIMKQFVRFYTRKIGAKSTEFITPSEKTKGYMRFTNSDVFVNVIPTGIDFDIFKSDNIDQQKVIDFKKEHNIKENTKMFLILGRVAKEKSMDVSIHGFYEYHKAYPNEDIRMIIVGGGPQKEELEQYVKTLGVDHLVDFIGPVPASEVPFYYHLADIYTSASLTETQGLTFMEAMAASTVVLARFDANLAETIYDGETGFFFVDDETFVIKAHLILEMSKEERKNIIDNAMKIIDKYSFERFYTNIMEVYRRAIRKYW